MTASAPAMFVALGVRNYRLYTAGQFVSVAGNWAHNVALGWLVLELTGSGALLGAVLSARYIPLVLLGAWGGLVADRHDKRRVLIVCAATEATISLLLGTLVAVHLITVPLVVALAAALGLVSVVSGPTRQSFISELVDRDLVGNAIALNSVVMSTARIIGPAAAGVLIAATGTAPCFLFNAASFVVVIEALRRVHVEGMRRPAPLARQRGQIRAGLRHVATHRALLIPMVMVTVTGTLAWEYPVTLPLLATDTFAGNASMYGAMTSCLAVGAVLGGLVAARRQRVRVASLARACLLWGVVMLVTAAAPTRGTVFVLLVGVGLLATLFNSQTKTLLQVSALPHFRGRVMALWVIAWQGTTLVGGPAVGAIAELSSPRWALAAGGVSACLVAACGLVRMPPRPEGAEPGAHGGWPSPPRSSRSPE